MLASHNLRVPCHGIDSPIASTNLLQVRSEYDDFAALHKRQHADDEEYYGRRALFLHHHALIKQHNMAADKSYRLDLNKFADWTDSEYRMLLGKKRSRSTHEAKPKVPQRGSPHKLFEYDLGHSYFAHCISSLVFPSAFVHLQTG
jgi:hypothetical protein